jgi:glucokinase
VHQSDLQHFAGPAACWRDIGGTNARRHWKLPRIVLMLCRYWPVVIIPISAAVQAYLKQVSAHIAPGERQDAGIAIANPVVGDIVSMTNHHWSFSIRDLQADAATGYPESRQ